MAKKKTDKKAEAPKVIDSLAEPDALETGEKPENWADQTDSEPYETAKKLYATIAKAYENMSEQSDRIEEYWNIYSAQPDENLQYAGNSQGYVPAVRDCINSRAKRTLKQLFPVNHKHVDGISADGTVPFTQLSLLEHYVRRTDLKSIVRSDLIAGDTTGQWCLMLDWTKSKRLITRMVKRNPIVETIDGEDVSELGIPDPNEDEDTPEDEEVIEEGPEVVDFAVEDLAVIPPTCNDLQKARAVCLRLRLSKDAFQDLIDEGVCMLPEGVESVDDYFDGGNKLKAKRDREKKQTEDAGIKTEGTNKHLLVYMTYTQLEFDEGEKRSGVIFYGGPDQILGIIRNPLWSGKVPILSKPVDRLKGSFYGKSKIEPVKFLQWQLCDFWNMGQDSAMYSLLPIWTADPTKVPQWSTLVMGLAAVWPAPPDSIKQLTSPQLWKDATQICDAIKRQIWESMDVNEMMMGRMPAGRKNNQLMGQMQQEQATNISDHAERYEEEMLNPLVEMLFELDQQYRTEEVTIASRGEIGVKAAIEVIPPVQWSERYFFRWCGTSYQMNMQRMQQMIAWVNVIKGTPPQMLGGRRLDLAPFLDKGTEDIFGPDLAPKILIDERNKFTVSPDMENAILHNGFLVQVHEADEDQEHIQAHMQAAGLTGDPLGLYKQHIAAHAQALQVKREKAMAEQQQGAKGVPGSPIAGQPGAAGAPRPGAQPAPPRPAQNPAGAIQQDAMAGAPGRG